MIMLVCNGVKWIEDWIVHHSLENAQTWISPLCLTSFNLVKDVHVVNRAEEVIRLRSKIDIGLAFVELDHNIIVLKPFVSFTFCQAICAACFLIRAENKFKQKCLSTHSKAIEVAWYSNFVWIDALERALVDSCSYMSPCLFHDMARKYLFAVLEINLFRFSLLYVI